MIAVKTLVVNIKLMEDLVTRGTLFELKVTRNVRVAQMTKDIKESKESGKLTKQYPMESVRLSHAD